MVALCLHLEKVVVHMQLVTVSVQHLLRLQSL